MNKSRQDSIVVFLLLLLLFSKLFVFVGESLRFQ